MDDFANLAPSERYEIITEAAILMGLVAAFVGWSISPLRYASH